MQRIILLTLFLGWLPLASASEADPIPPRILTLSNGQAWLVDTGGYTKPQMAAVTLQYNVTRYLGFAVGYQSSQPFKAQSASTTTLKLTGPTAGLVLQLPLGRYFELFARSDAFMWRLQQDSLAGGADDHGTNMANTVGARMALSNRYALILQTARMSAVGGSDIRRSSIGLALRF